MLSQLLCYYNGTVLYTGLVGTPGHPNELDLRVDREGELPLGTQLAWKLRSLIGEGRLGPGDRLPSVREAAEAAGVNVNTVRSVYSRLERDGLVSSEQGRGTFVARPRKSEAATRHELRHQIARLEAELVRRPRLPAPAEPQRSPSPARAGLLSAEELTHVRDDLLDRLRDLDAARVEVMQRLNELPAAQQPAPAGKSSPSLAGAHVRWVGA